MDDRSHLLMMDPSLESVIGHDEEYDRITELADAQYREWMRDLTHQDLTPSEFPLTIDGGHVWLECPRCGWYRSGPGYLRAAYKFAEHHPRSGDPYINGAPFSSEMSAAALTGCFCIIAAHYNSAPSETFPAISCPFPKCSWVKQAKTLGQAWAVGRTHLTDEH